MGETNTLVITDNRKVSGVLFSKAESAQGG